MRLLVLFTLASGLVCIAQSIITTGIVYLMSDFSVSSTQAQWSYSAFLLVVGVMIPLSAFISRRFSSKAIFFFSLIIFLLGSVICYFSTSMTVLIIGRILLGRLITLALFSKNVDKKLPSIRRRGIFQFT